MTNTGLPIRLQPQDAMCGECNARIHGSGHRKSHQVEAYAKSKKGWQVPTLSCMEMPYHTWRCFFNLQRRGQGHIVLGAPTLCAVGRETYFSMLQTL